MCLVQIAVCDDEFHMCEMLRQQVSAFCAAHGVTAQIHAYTDPLALSCETIHFDLVYLDIQMPHMDGMTLARQIRGKNPDCILVFITVLEEYSLEAFAVEAMDYICKPIDEARLVRSLTRALAQIQQENEASILVQTAHWCKTVKMNEIYYCEVINRKIYLHTKEGVLEYYGKLKEIEQQLDARFFKCHRSYLVNLDYLKAYQEGQITLEHGEQIPVSRLRHQELMDKMLQYMKN